VATSTSQTAFATLEKSFTYRGVREHWSNTYHLDQIPPNNADWKTVCDQIWGLEGPMLAADVQIERYLGHAPGTPPVLVFESDIPPSGEGGIAGTFVPDATEFPTPGDAAMWVRWGTTQKTSRGKPIYLRNYYHGAFWKGTHDTVAQRQVTQLNALGLALQTGLSVSGVTYRRAGPRGAVAQNHAAGTFITTRTLKHRGKRKRVTQSEVDKLRDFFLTQLEKSTLGPLLGP